jgi:cytochrome c biogenesis protein CcdA
MNKKLIALIGIAAFIAVIALVFASGIVGVDVLGELSRNNELLLLIVAVSALIDSINPCAFSVLLITIAFLFSVGKRREDILKIGGVYVFGIFLVYFLIGLGILQALAFFSVPEFMTKVGASLIIAFGVLHLIGHFFPKFPVKLKIPDASKRKMASLMEKASLPTAFFLGVLVGLSEFPCTGAAYLLVLGLLHDHETFVSGLAYLLFYNLIFILPLVIILLMASDNALFEKVKAWKSSKSGGMKVWGGIAAIVLGLVILLL